MANNKAKVRIRMYRQGLGDCFLLTFFQKNKQVHMLVDCGTVGNRATEIKLPEVIDDIKTATGEHLDLLVVTHEHEDHVSGFNTKVKKERAFDSIKKVDNVWMAWTEDAKDEMAQDLEKFKGDLLKSVRFAINRLSQNNSLNEAEQQALSRMASATRELLAFDGAPLGADALLAANFAKTVDEAMDYASKRAGEFPEFLRPGEVIEPEWLPGWRFYVLGPPRDLKALNVMGEHGSSELYGFHKGLAADLASMADFHETGKVMPDYRNNLEDAEARQQLETGLPFDACFRIEEDNGELHQQLFQAYNQEDWRTIDYDWLASTDELALQLNNATNNTSLVLAIECLEDKRVLLFPADAQLGNWQSWEKVKFQVTNPNGASDEVTWDHLLERIVFYKVGHHSSHNATRKPKGLEEMKHKDLVAMIPVDSQAATNKGWVMPEPALYDELLRRTRGRVLRSDTGWPSEKPSFWTKQEWEKIQEAWEKWKPQPGEPEANASKIDVQELYIDYWLY